MKGDAVPQKKQPVLDDRPVSHFSQYAEFVPEDGPSIDLSHLTAQPEAAESPEGAPSGK